MKTLIVGEALLVKHRDEFYMSATDIKSLQQWIDPLPNPILALPTVKINAKPPGKQLIPRDWNCHGVAVASRSYIHRRIAARKQLSNLLDDEPSLVYCRMPSYYASWAFRIARLHRIPVVTEFHGDWHEAFRSIRAESILARLVRRSQAYLAYKSSRMMGAESIAACCIGPMLKERYVSPSVKCLVTTNHTVPENKYFMRRHHEIDRVPVILFVGEIEHRKGLHILFDSLGILHAEGYDFELRLFGTGSETEKLKATAAALGFEQKVQFLGYLSNDELFEEYRKATLFVLPSIGAEGVPRAIHEAMAMSCPVVATDIGSTSWQLRDGAGIVVPPGDSSALKSAIEKILSDAQLRHKVGELGHKNALEHTYERQSAEIREFIEQVLSTL